MNDKDKLLMQTNAREQGALFVVEIIRTLIGSIIWGLIIIFLYWILKIRP